MLGAGEQLRRLTITVEQLLDRSAQNAREWDKGLHKGLGTHTWQRSPSSQKMGTLYPHVHPFWLLSNGGSARTVIHFHRRQGSLTLIA
jgi:hypothetical protein